VKTIDADTFTVNGIIPARASLGARRAFSMCKSPPSAAPHGRSTWERVVVAASPTPGGAPRHQRATDLCGVIDSTTLSLPSRTAALAVHGRGRRAHWRRRSAYDPRRMWTAPLAASGRGRAQRNLDVKWFGAKADWERPQRGPTASPRSSGPRGTGRRERGLGSSG